VAAFTEYNKANVALLLSSRPLMSVQAVLWRNRHKAFARNFIARPDVCAMTRLAAIHTPLATPPVEVQSRGGSNAFSEKNVHLRLAWFGAPMGRGPDSACWGRGRRISYLDWGIKVPPEILDNPLLGGLVAIAVGAIVGALVTFSVRLCWAPFHFRLEPLGGLRAAARTKLGDQMWPTLMMISGLTAFVIFFGAGFLLWLTTGQPKPATAALCKAANTAYNVSRKLEAIDAIYDQLSGPMSDLQNRGGLLTNSFNAKLNQGTVISELDDYAKKAKDVFNTFFRTVEAHNYFRDVYDIIIRNNNYAYQASESDAARLVNELQKLHNTLPRDQIPAYLQSNTYMKQWESSILQLSTWIVQKQNMLRAKRTEIEALDICGN
jgi:hypothetical protein